ncbi:NAD(P)/FAD-dependent oxidoreductase [Aerococcus kribbianus]|uniref:FAD-dependent oxidoreductase n=1 Tax=Aerococcus kribbianus TaxID=2999064 RepID=A0A9X3FV02_9LACT|nr:MULTISPECIES: FAD-dependent oxidoreductase [unclassified Aerococcus]MCZ0717446.1 FAD-dependent oxidoreductase [Aerococcus sp. YH-aer221]MCZ0725734.1 FAD-dependent oxidoreductase [Aerococcus sp. YH-aer222]
MTQSYKYIILGGGMAGAHAAYQIRQHDQEGSLLVISQEVDKPYFRPPLSKEFWTEPHYSKESIFYDINNDESIDFLLKTTVAKIIPDQQKIVTDQGENYSYNKLLYAPGGEPKWIPGPDSERVLAMRTLDDYRNLEGLTSKDSKVIVVGGGWVGAELAAGLKVNDIDVSLVFPDDVLNKKRLPLEIAEKFQEAFLEIGVSLVNNAYADSYRVEGDQVILSLENGQELTADVLVLGIGLDPRVELAEAAGLEVDNGVVANEYLQSSDPNIYAAGDVVSYPDVIIGRNRFGHEDQAEQSGDTAGRNMAGLQEVYGHGAPLSYTDVLGISIEGVGELSRNRDDEIIEKVVDDGYIVYYLSKGKPSGILTYNVKVDMDQAREILANPPANPEDLPGMLKPM